MKIDTMIQFFASKLAKRKAAASCTHSKASLRLPEQAALSGAL